MSKVAYLNSWQLFIYSFCHSYFRGCHMRWKQKKKKLKTNTKKLLANVTAKLDEMNLSDCDSNNYELNYI